MRLYLACIKRENETKGNYKMTKANEKMKQAADQVIALMESEGTNWVKPWTSHGAPHNVITGKAYRGSNMFF
jgi:antirestriction protein ArdC